MALMYFTLWFLVVVALLWDLHRGHVQSQMILRDVAAVTRDVAEAASRIEQFAERIAQMTVEI